MIQSESCKLLYVETVALHDHPFLVLWCEHPNCVHTLACVHMAAGVGGDNCRQAGSWLGGCSCRTAWDRLWGKQRQGGQALGQAGWEGFMAEAWCGYGTCATRAAKHVIRL